MEEAKSRGEEFPLQAGKWVAKDTQPKKNTRATAWLCSHTVPEGEIHITADSECVWHSDAEQKGVLHNGQFHYEPPGETGS